MDGSTHIEDTWSVAGRTFRSRLIVGTGKYRDYAQNAAAAEAAGAEIVTVALRRVNLDDPTQPRLTDHVSPQRFIFMPNTAGCYSGEEAVRTLRLAREAGGWDLVKLEVLTQTKHLYPDMEETLRALKLLVADGFSVMVYCSDDPVWCRSRHGARVRCGADEHRHRRGQGSDPHGHGHEARGDCRP
jgi:thiazole synthase